MDLSDVRGASSPCVAVWLLGPFRVVRGGVDEALAPSRKVRALVAYLDKAPRPSGQSLRVVLGRPQTIPAASSAGASAERILEFQRKRSSCA